MNTFEMKPHHCPKCTYQFDCASLIANAESKGPQPGDLTLCIKCATILSFTEEMGLRLISDRELRRLSLSTRGELARAQYAIRRMRSMS